MKKKEHATKIQMLVALGLLLAALGGTVFAFFRYYSSNINETLYTERINQMDAVTGQLFRNLDNVIETRWLEVRIQVESARDKSAAEPRGAVQLHFRAAEYLTDE